MLALLLLVLSAAPSVKEAEALAARKDAETLVLKYGAVRAEDYSAKERPRLAKALLAGAAAASDDPILALGLAERALALHRSPEALTELARLEARVDQRASAAEHLDEAIRMAPRNATALAARGELAIQEEDWAKAVTALEQAKAAGAKVGPQLEKARREQKTREQAVEQLKGSEKQAEDRIALAVQSATSSWIRQIEIEAEQDREKRRLAPDGVRTQEIRHFAFTYSAGSRGIGQMMEFEKRVEKVLDKTYEFVSDQLRHKIERKTPVMLMTREEYAAKYGGTNASGAGGFWDGKQIVINGGSQIDDWFARIMVHEFTHALVTDVIGGREGSMPRWMNEGLAENVELCAAGTKGQLDPSSRTMLAGLKRQGTLPTLGELDALFRGPVQNAGAAYALASIATRLMIEQEGYEQYLEALRELSRSPRAAPVIERHFVSLDKLQDAINEEIR